MEKSQLVYALLIDNDINVITINKYIRALKISKRDKVIIMKQFHDNRTNVIERAKKYYLFEDFYIKYFLFITNKKFSNELLDDKDVYNITHYINMNSKIYSGILSALISLCSINQVKIIFDNANCLKQIHIFKLIKRSLQLGDVSVWLSEKYRIDESEKELKLELIKNYYSPNGITIKRIECEFAKINEDYFKDYIKKIPSFTNLVDKDKNLFELRYDQLGRKKVYKKVLTALKNKKSYSFVRLSDGEAYAFTSCPKLSRRQEIHWWGEELPLKLRQDIKQEFNESLKLKFDMVGMPTPYKFLHYVDYKNVASIELNDNLDTKVINRLSYATLELITKIKNNSLQANSYCEDQINNLLFNEKVINRLANKARKLIVISGYRTEFIKDKITHNNLLVKEIPTHYMLSGKGETVNSAKPLPFVYKDILSWIELNVEPGDLCLVSAGFIGKLFVGEAAKKGAISLDVGQSLKVLF